MGCDRHLGRLTGALIAVGVISWLRRGTAK